MNLRSWCETAAASNDPSHRNHPACGKIADAGISGVFKDFPAKISGGNNAANYTALASNG